MVKTRKIHI